MKRVLVVDDEPLVRAVIAETLADEGFDVTEAASGDEAKRLVDDDGFDLLLTDVHMPGSIDGLQLAAFAREADPTLPIVVVTGRPEVGRTVHNLQPRCALVTKPYTVATILSAISLVSQ